VQHERRPQPIGDRPRSIGFQLGTRAELVIDVVGGHRQAGAYGERQQRRRVGAARERDGDRGVRWGERAPTQQLAEQLLGVRIG
jgi:hypothetical protein